MKNKASLLLLLALVVAGLAWLTLRVNLEARLELAAGRDLRAIVDLVADDVAERGAALARLDRTARANALTGADSAFAGTLRRIRDEHFRRVYFFDAQGVLTSGGEPSAAPDGQPAPAIVGSALADPRLPAQPATGMLVEPYADDTGTRVIGAWRWLPALALGVVAERPHAAIATPLGWVDTLFGLVLAGLVAGALFTGLPSLRELAAAFRPPASRRCGPYQIERLVGEGAMADVYLARHRHLGRVVALKVMKGGKQTDELTARFDREARLGSRVAHPNIVTIFEHGRAPDGSFFYAMEYIHGLTLPQWIAQHGPLVPARAVRILQQVSAAVGAMHAAGLLHRDIKPDNVMAHAANGDYDLVKLIDFGLVKNVHSERTRDLTRNLRVLGTPAYMAPERMLNPSAVDPRTDLYGIGAIGYYLLTGRRPFEAAPDGDLAQQVLNVEAPRASRASPFPIPAPLDALIASLLAKDMDERPADAAVLAAALDDIARLVPWRRDLAGRWWRSVFAGSEAGST